MIRYCLLEKDFAVSWATATRCLDALAKGGILEKHRLGRENYYINRELVRLLFELPPMDIEGMDARSTRIATQ